MTRQRRANSTAGGQGDCAQHAEKLCANEGKDSGCILAKVSDNERAIVTVGLAKDVDEVNQYAG